jgi:hypothetical protein
MCHPVPLSAKQFVGKTAKRAVWHVGLRLGPNIDPYEVVQGHLEYVSPVGEQGAVFTGWIRTLDVNLPRCT